MGISLLAVFLLTPSGYGQLPGTKTESKEPQTSAQKLANSRDTYAGPINLYNEPGDTGPVDERVEAFSLRKFNQKIPAGLVEMGKKKYLVAYGVADLSADTTKPGWTLRRILALDQAELKARASMVELIETKIENEQLFEVFADYGTPVAEKLKLLKEAKERGSLSGDGYRDALRTFAIGQVIGAITVKTFEGVNNERYKAVRVLLWSPTLRDMALNALQDADYFLPAEEVKEEDLDQIPTKEEDLVHELGSKVYFNKKGQRYYVCYGQAEPIARSKDEIPRAYEIARDVAEMAAQGYLARTLAAEVTVLKLKDMKLVNETLKTGENAEETNSNFAKRLETVVKGIKIKGMTVHRQWTYKHPEWKTVVVGCVVVWTPDTRSLIKDLGLDQRFEINNPDALADYLVRKYGKGALTRPIEKGDPKEKPRPGNNDSKDPKKLP